MSIPASGTGAVPVTAGAWPALTAAEKRERLLSVAPTCSPVTDWTPR